MFKGFQKPKRLGSGLAPDRELPAKIAKKGRISPPSTIAGPIVKPQVPKPAGSVSEAMIVKPAPSTNTLARSHR